MAYHMLRLNKGGRFPSMFEVLSTAPALTAPSTLLSLARELRDLIYDELIWTYHEATMEAEKLEKQNLKEQDLDEQDPDEQDPEEHDPEEHGLEEQSLPLLHNLTANKKRFSQITGILLVNRQIHHEFRSQLYRLVHGRYIAKMPDNKNAFSWDSRLYSKPDARPHMVHLRYLKLVLETPENPGRDTTWSDLDQRLKRNIETMLKALPDLEDLVVTVVLRPYFQTPTVPAETVAEKSKTLRIDHITGFHLGGVSRRRAVLLRPVGGQPPKTKVPKDIDSDFFKPDIYHPNKADTLRELRIKQDALMHSPDGKNHINRFHPCLKTFTKRLAMRFACLPKNPMIFDTQKDTYYEQSGVLEKTERQKMPWHFVEEWGTATSEEITRLLAVSLGPDWWFTWRQSPVLTPNELNMVFNEWQAMGMPTRDTVEEEWEEWEETLMAQVEAMHEDDQPTSADDSTSSYSIES